jgi:hypothetical protein
LAKMAVLIPPERSPPGPGKYWRSVPPQDIISEATGKSSLCGDCPGAASGSSGGQLHQEPTERPAALEASRRICHESSDLPRPSRGCWRDRRFERQVAPDSVRHVALLCRSSNQADGRIGQSPWHTSPGVTTSLSILPAMDISVKHLYAAPTPNRPGNCGVCGSGSGASACAAPSPRSAGCARESR